MTNPFICETLELQMDAFESAKAKVQSMINDAVEAFRLSTNENRILVRDQIRGFGSLCVGPLLKMIPNAENQETRVLAALLVNVFGNNSADQILFDEIRLVGNWSGAAATRFRIAENHSAIPSLLEGLSKISVEQYNSAVAYIFALQQLNCDMPDWIIERFNVESAPWQVRTLFESTAVPQVDHGAS